MNTQYFFSKTVAVPTSMLVLSLVAFGCASTPPPNEKLAVAEATVQQANTATTSESAPGELQIANAKLASARQAEANKDYPRASQLAEQADLDAQVAMLHAQSVRSAKAAQESQVAALVLREELNRKATH